MALAQIQDLDRRNRRTEIAAESLNVTRAFYTFLLAITKPDPVQVIADSAISMANIAPVSAERDHG